MERQRMPNGLNFLVLFGAVGVLALAWLVGGVVVLALTAPALVTQYGPAVGVLLILSCLLPPLLCAQATHEAGHLLTGAGLGLSPRYANVGPMTWTEAGGRWRLGWDRRRSWFQGGVLTRRPARSRWGAALVILSGSLANLAAGVAAAVVAAADLPPLLRCWVGLFAVHSLILGVGNLLPTQVGDVHSDGFAFYHLLARKGATPSPE